MAVPCPGCGREYDVTLFQFGRTIHCTCGTRVALEPRVRSLEPAEEPRFMADAMLGRLARWLRVMGYDAAYDAHIEDADLVRRALHEHRVILTRDRALAEEWTIPHLLILESQAPLDQLREVAEGFQLDWRGRLFSRCTRCNAPLREAVREELRGRVPPSVFAEQDRFARCDSCDRIYWEGSHTQRMRGILQRTLGGSVGASPSADPE